MPHVISELSQPDVDGTITPQVVIDLGVDERGRGVAFATSDGTFEIPPIVEETGMPEGFAIVALLAADHARAIALGYTPVVSLDPCGVA